MYTTTQYPGLPASSPTLSFIISVHPRLYAPKPFCSDNPLQRHSSVPAFLGSGTPLHSCPSLSALKSILIPLHPYLYASSILASLGSLYTPSSSATNLSSGLPRPLSFAVASLSLFHISDRLHNPLLLQLLPAAPIYGGIFSLQFPPKAFLSSTRLKQPH